MVFIKTLLTECAFRGVNAAPRIINSADAAFVEECRGVKYGEKRYGFHFIRENMIAYADSLILMQVSFQVGKSAGSDCESSQGSKCEGKH